LADLDVKTTKNYADYGASSWKEIEEKKILFYDKDKPYYAFTNFYPAAITVDGMTWPTSEHYYQAMKFPNNVRIQQEIERAQTPREAFNRARKYQHFVRADWKVVNLNSMKRAVWEKCSQHLNIRLMLLTTGAAILIEDAGANDAFYGAGAGYKGDNYLGRILMRVRTALQARLVKSIAHKPAHQKQQSVKTVCGATKSFWKQVTSWFSSWFSTRKD
jgi:ribA/ribD-fused uncharacterized protein